MAFRLTLFFKSDGLLRYGVIGRNALMVGKKTVENVFHLNF